MAFNPLGEKGLPLEQRMLVKAAEATAPTHPHPGVESAKANLLLGPPVAFLDRVRDAIRTARDSGEGGETEEQRQ